MKRLALLSVVLVLALLGLSIPYLVSTKSVSADTPTLTFAGYKWEIRDYSGLPGPDSYTASNAWVDGNGYLHLKITNVNGVWECAEVRTLNSLGFGTYTFDVQTDINNLDHNVILGLFTCPNSGGRVNEIDIEYEKAFNDSGKNAKYTVFTTTGDGGFTDYRFNSTLTGPTTQTYTRTSTSVDFSSSQGGTDIASWNYTPTSYTTDISQEDTPAYMDLWLYNNQPPSNYGQQAYVDPEIVITGFTFTAAGSGLGGSGSGSEITSNGNFLYQDISNAVMRILTLSHALFSTWVDVQNISDNNTPITISLQPGSGRFFQSLASLTVKGTAMIADLSSVLLSSMGHTFH